MALGNARRERGGEAMQIDKFNSPYLDIPIKNGIIHIQKRPSYCDRGRYLVNVFSNNDIELSIDAPDGFPRYYFDWDCMVKEINLWILARGIGETP